MNSKGSTEEINSAKFSGKRAPQASKEAGDQPIRPAYGERDALTEDEIMRLATPSSTLLDIVSTNRYLPTRIELSAGEWVAISESWLSHLLFLSPTLALARSLILVTPGAGGSALEHGAAPRWFEGLAARATPRWMVAAPRAFLFLSHFPFPILLGPLQSSRTQNHADGGTAGSLDSLAAAYSSYGGWSDGRTTVSELANRPRKNASLMSSTHDPRYHQSPLPRGPATVEGPVRGGLGQRTRALKDAGRSWPEIERQIPQRSTVSLKQRWSGCSGYARMLDWDDDWGLWIEKMLDPFISEVS
ncbi:hypothetical protein ACJ73_05873 [Blastomyces percursus]|uniref:Uncharacterized protein n=1 Tax=Blastomyces percursus TaxID=1658174 RepID=A0A1J9QRD7_9EURO|nr:hypothetical protein ACJ73_05873 [Blastomyces percursus]